MAEITYRSTPGYKFLLVRRPEATEVMHEHMLAIGRRAEMSDERTRAFAKKATELLLPYPGKKPANNRDRKVFLSTTTTMAFDEENRMVGYITYGDSVTSTARHFHRFDRYKKLHARGDDAAMHRPRVLFGMAALPDSGVEHRLASLGMRSTAPKQPIIFESINALGAAPGITEQAGLQPSTVVEQLPLIEEYPEVLVTQYYGRSALYASGRLMASMPAA